MPVIGSGRLTPREQELKAQVDLLYATVKSIAAMPATAAALSVPAYNIGNLPWAANFPSAIINILDDPQGLARSVDLGSGVWHWTSEVDGSDLGAGNAPSS